ncbi:endonuclease [Mycoplasmopsis columboralis]|uniref:Extracellular ribonuclease n=1 Tax=Mycoplasmopsis columboralis TaxID=171282 RepID=A0A449B7K6_9BACT|nr:endonuclease [Mycoplasmopsis columboralis]VEU76574.1 Extracellular ribonuclease precursor [Mycoplasmopsis columboralis]
MNLKKLLLISGSILAAIPTVAIAAACGPQVQKDQPTTPEKPAEPAPTPANPGTTTGETPTAPVTPTQPVNADAVFEVVSLDNLKSEVAFSKTKNRNTVRARKGADGSLVLVSGGSQPKDLLKLKDGLDLSKLTFLTYTNKKDSSKTYQYIEATITDDNTLTFTYTYDRKSITQVIKLSDSASSNSTEQPAQPSNNATTTASEAQDGNLVVVSVANLQAEIEFSQGKGFPTLRLRKFDDSGILKGGGSAKKELVKFKEGIDLSKVSFLTYTNRKDASKSYDYLDAKILADGNLEVTYTYDGQSVTQVIKVNNSTSSNNSSTGSNSSVSVEPVVVASGNYEYVYDSSNDYYKALEGLSGVALAQKINEIQNSRHKTTNYGMLPSFYNSSSAFKDNFYEKDGTILDIYSENPAGKDPYTYRTYSGNQASAEGQGMNREHVIPQSWFNKAEPIRSDAHFVWPTDIKVNGLRGNLPHDNVVNVSQTTRNGSKLGANDLRQSVFEPIDAFKGDVARAYLYFSLTYNNKDIYSGTSIFQRNFPYLPSHYLNTYLGWNAKDVVDPFDVTRNNEGEKYNKLRNPFIDYPDLAENLYGSNPKPFVNKGVLVSLRAKS